MLLTSRGKQSHLKVVSVIYFFGQNINDHKHLIFPHDQLPAPWLHKQRKYFDLKRLEKHKSSVRFHMAGFSLTAGLWGGQLAFCEEISDEWDSFMFRPRITDTTFVCRY